ILTVMIFRQPTLWCHQALIPDIILLQTSPMRLFGTLPCLLLVLACCVETPGARAGSLGSIARERSRLSSGFSKALAWLLGFDLLKETSSCGWVWPEMGSSALTGSVIWFRVSPHPV